MRGEIVKWLPATPRHGAFGFVKPEVGERDVIVVASDIVEGIPYVGATMMFTTRPTSVGGNRRLQAYNAKVVG